MRDPQTLMLISAILLLFPVSPVCSAAQETPLAAADRDWFGFEEPLVSKSGVCLGEIGALPAFTATAPSAGMHLVRVSLPFPPGALPQGMGLSAACGGKTLEADLRRLTWHPGKPKSVRRGIVTFPFEFVDTTPHRFELQLIDSLSEVPTFKHSSGRQHHLFQIASPFAGEVRIELDCTGAKWSMGEFGAWRADLIAPGGSVDGGDVQIVESGQYYLWARLFVPDPQWPRIIEVHADCLGALALQAHLQRRDQGDGTTPDFGWRISGGRIEGGRHHSFSEGESCVVKTLEDGSGNGQGVFTFPIAPLTRRGAVDSSDSQAQSAGPNEADSLVYYRCRAAEKVPFQTMAWRRAAFVFGPASHTPRNALLEPALDIHVSPELFDVLYGSGVDADAALWPVIGDCQRYIRSAIAKSATVGDDFGNVTGFLHGQPHGSYYGMNRLNHCPAIFEEAYRTSDRTLRDTALLWCSNMHDLSLWWGPTEDFGGTRYNSAVAAGRLEHRNDRTFMWRVNEASNFCTKGYDSFFYAYEETGDPRMLTALRCQVDYARKFVHTDRGECRNIGDVMDFVRLYRFTGAQTYLDEALRLFRGLRSKLGDDNLFSQGGQPIAANSPFINDDEVGYKHPFAKPYIIGYALQGLPELLRECPDEPRLKDVVRAVADFLAQSQDSTGGWRYPHPLSTNTLLGQAMEQAAQIKRAAAVLEEQGESIDNLLDAIERTLQMYVNAYEKTGTLLNELQGWEFATGKAQSNDDIYRLYEKPEDRDRSRDYSEGTVAVGAAPPEGLVYFTEVLRFYLKHRPAERLLNAGSALAQVLERVADKRLRLLPCEKGTSLRIVHPENDQIAFTLWGPEWATFPRLDYSELADIAVDWRRDSNTRATWYTLEKDDAAFTACFVPHIDYVECTCTAWPNGDVHPEGTFGIGPCMAMGTGIFGAEEADLQSRVWLLSGGEWTTVGSYAEGNLRSALHIKEPPSPETTGDRAANNWRTIQSPRPHTPLTACVSADRQWVAATAVECANSLGNTAGLSHRCIHSQGSVPLRSDGPTVLRFNVYLLQGDLSGLRARYEGDVERWAATTPVPPHVAERFDTYGVRAALPTFNDQQVRRLAFPWSWQEAHMPFRNWRAEARRVYLDALSTPPGRAAFDPATLAVDDRGAYEARKLALNINADSRIKAYLLVPKGVGPFPGMITLHDHGAHFSIGKEKVVRPFGERDEVLKDAQDWVDKNYGGRWIGDELASRGYVVLAIDMLFWGDRGRAEGVRYEEQQALAANMFQIGCSWAGYNVWDDVRSAEFLQGLPEVDPDRIGCMGLSMGANRAWHLAAATDIVKVGAAICWMSDTQELTEPGNNQTKGQSAFSMLHPGLRNALDYPDVASIAAPKPMLFFNGAQDSLFPLAGVERAYAKMCEVWAAQGAEERLVCKVWDVPHVLNRDMQDECFVWFDRWLK